MARASIEAWWSAGELTHVSLGGVDRRIFVRQMGSGAPMTLLHGFPSSSHDWARIAPALAESHRLLMFDFLGFGASEKPVTHDYSIGEQADLVEAMWARERITTTKILVHDYAVSVAQELLARRAAGELAVRLEAACFLNGGLYPDVYRPQPGQLALLDPELGPQISENITEELWSTALAPTFAPDFDAARDLADIWLAMSREDGQLITHRLIQYMNDRTVHSDRWVKALESADLPISFVWGMLDPISGAHMAERIRERLAAAPLTALDDVGHWPALEAPQRTASAVLGA